MPGKVKVKIISGRNLPVMDRSSDTTDAYVEIKLGTTTYKTDVCRKSLHPKWNSEWYRFELDDAELQDEPLQIRLMDHDTYSANDAIGKVYIDLNPLLLPAASLLLKYEWNGEARRNREGNANSVMSGWIPVYDTMHGIRGEVNVTVKVELFSDSNKFRQSSCGVQFFCSKTIPHGYYAQIIHGFVEELVVSDDPEYQWIDKIRTPRASNEARQTLFFKLSGELQRKIGLKALDLGGNAVIGYTQCFDLEGESGIVARGIGSAVTLVKLVEQPPHAADTSLTEDTIKYLEFLGYDKSFRLNMPKVLLNVTPRSEILNEFDAAFRRAQFRRHLSHSEFHRSSLTSESHLPVMHHSSSLQTLLKQGDARGTSRISHRIKNLKYPSVFTKKIKAKLSDESPMSSSHSLSELVERKKKKSLFKRTTSDSSVMAELLVRSVIRAQSNLDCISEFNAEETENQGQSINSSSSESSASDDDERLSDSVEIDTVSNIVKNVELIERRMSSKDAKDVFGLKEKFSSTLLAPDEDQECEICEIHEIPEVEDEVLKFPPVATAEDFSVCDSDDENTGGNNEKLLIPPILLGAEVKEGGLIQTAMQTMLLEKVNIMGTYSPPTSPKSTVKDTFFPAFTIPRTPTTLSLSEMSSEKETVLGAPFVSMNELGKSDQELIANKTSLEQLKTQRRASFSTATTSSIFPSPPIKFKHNKGLLRAALNNVALETVQDILATTHSSENANRCDLPRSAVNTKIDKGNISNNPHASLTPDVRNSESTRPLDQGHHRTESTHTRVSRSPCVYRRSSDSDLSITPKGNSLTGSDRSGGGGPYLRNNLLHRTVVHKDNFDMLEYPFLTLSKYPHGFISYLGGAVCARSVKLLERITNLEEPESRDMWWSELRLEIRSHARALNCNAVLGYSETTSICEDVCVLSATGTAAIIGSHYTEAGEKNESPEKDAPLSCSVCHLPYARSIIPLRLSTSKCFLCKREKVPDILMATIEIPEGIPIVGHGCFLQVHVCRMLRESRGESNAKEISDGLPFLEYELHRVLVSKLKMKGMNAIFGLRVRISVGEKMLVGIATGSSVFLNALPPPPIPKLVSDRSVDDKTLATMQKEIHDIVRMNKEVYQLRSVEEIQNGRVCDVDDLEDDSSVFDYSLGNKDCCILEVDDPEDAEFLNLLMEHRPPDGFHVVTTEFVPGLEDLEIVKNLQMFTQIWRSKIQPPFNLSKHLERLLQSVYFKLRRMVPCALCDLQFRLDLPEPDEIQLCVLGMALGLGDVQKAFRYKRTAKKNGDDDLIFNYEEDAPLSPQLNCGLAQTPSMKLKHKSLLVNKLNFVNQRHVPHVERHGVDITPLSYIPGAKIEHYLGNLNFFFIRETQSIREEGGLSGFVHSFVTEVLAVVRAHVTALGGNAMVAYFMTECVLNHNLHKNQGQCLINVGGDVVYVSYKEDK